MKPSFFFARIVVIARAFALALEFSRIRKCLETDGLEISNRAVISRR
jgi:hypothetical protein